MNKREQEGPGRGGGVGGETEGERNRNESWTTKERRSNRVREEPLEGAAVVAGTPGLENT